MLTNTMNYIEQYQTLARATSKTTPSWLGSMRQCAIERFEALGFPTTKNEDWHFTSVSPIVEAAYPVRSAPGGDVKPGDLSEFTFGATDWPTIVFVNGVYAPELSSLDSVPEGVRISDLATAIEQGDPLVERHLSKIAPYELHAFTALNTAFAVDGAVVRIAKEFEVDRPIHVVFVSDALAAKTQTNPRTLIVAERHSKATVIESYVSSGEASYFTNAVTEVLLEDGANLSHLKIQRESPRALHVGTIEAEQRRDSHYQSFSFSTGAALARTNIYTTLNGDGAGATLNGLYMLDGEQHCDHQTRIEHAQPNCFSRELYKGVLDGASHGVFNGKVYVHPIAQKTDGKQTNNVLLLSERAQVDTKPQLEIYADDVKCTHGATVGRIDQTALFYMKSRGINNELARRLLTYAFAAEVLETIEVDVVKQRLERATMERFTGLATVTTEWRR
jgi:Fe-S cluster assembly protein SufD